MYKLKNVTLAIITAFVLLSFTTLPTLFNSYNPTSSKRCNATPKITWTKDVHDFGHIPQGKPVSVAFTFTNNGDAPLFIINASTSCGCTIAEYPKEPIAPGKSSKIKVTYNASAVGVFTKIAMVKTNVSEEVKVLTIRGTVE